MGASYGTQQVNRRVAEAIMTYRHKKSARLAHAMPRKDITMTQDETFTGGLCLIGIESMSNYIVLEQAALARGIEKAGNIEARLRYLIYTFVAGLNGCPF